MTIPTTMLDRLRIASPCPIAWDSMVGGDHTRFCQHCNLHVYNISALSQRQAEELLANTEDRLCARLYRRADGTVLTQDCPVGWRAVKRRAAFVAGAALTALLSLFPGVNAQTKTKGRKGESCVNQLTIKRAAAQGKLGPLAGTITDATGAVIVNAHVTVINEKTKERQTAPTDEEGNFKFTALTTGSYTLKVEMQGFKSLTLKNLNLNAEEAVRLTVLLEIDGEQVLVGIVAYDDPTERVLKIEGITIRYEE